MSDSDRGSKRSINNILGRKKQRINFKRLLSSKGVLTQSTSITSKTPPIILSGGDYFSIHDAIGINETSAKPPLNIYTNNPNATINFTQQIEHIETPDVIFGENQIKDLAGIENTVAEPENTAEK